MAAPANPRSGAPFPRQAKWGLAAVVALAAAALLLPGRSASKPVPGGFLVDDLGRPAPLARELAPVTLVHFWASWCPPCLDELPALARLAREVPDARLHLVLVAVADRPDSAKALLAGTRMTTLFDPAWDVTHRFGTMQLPESYLIVDGKVRDKFIGATDWSDAAVRRRLEAEAGSASR